VAKKLVVIVAILLGVIITTHGCYTIIKHPSVMQADNADNADNSAVDNNHAGGNRDCVSCHQDYHQYPYGYYYSYYPDYYWKNPRWGEYYAYPWWWDYYYDRGSNNTGGGGAVDQGNKPPTRRGMEPPYANPRPGYLVNDSLTPPTFNPGISTPPVITSPGGTSTGGGTVTPPAQDKPKDQPKVEDKKPPKRRGGD
jgi:hypothetical protein